MNCLIWNCRGTGGKDFPMFIRDSTRIYKLDFVALLEPRISGTIAERVINKFGFANCVKVEAEGFSGGLWFKWKSCCPNLSVVSSSKYCIHFHVNATSPNS